METAIFAVAVLAGIGAATWYLRMRLDDLFDRLFQAEFHIQTLATSCSEIRDTLTEASKRNALREKPAQSTFDKPDDKIPSSVNRYIPVARRRAAAEAASAGPSSHKAEVMANNARVMETL